MVVVENCDTHCRCKWIKKRWSQKVQGEPMWKSLVQSKEHPQCNCSNAGTHGCHCNWTTNNQQSLTLMFTECRTAGSGIVHYFLQQTIFLGFKWRLNVVCTKFIKGFLEEMNEEHWLVWLTVTRFAKTGNKVTTVTFLWKWLYWQALNLAIWLQTGHSKILAEFRFGSGPNLACNSGT